jgi:hypothetical protein
MSVAGLTAPWGLPVLATVVSLIAVAGVWILGNWMQTNSWKTVGRLLAPPGALGRALLPLLLPVAVICYFASPQLGLPLELASGVLLAVLVWLLVRGEGEVRHERTNLIELKNALAPTTPYPRELVPPFIVGAVGALVFFVGAFGSQLGTWKSTAGWSGVCQYVALIILAFAASLRVFGYATSLWRIVTAVALSLLVVRSLTAAGVFRGEDTWNAVHLTARETTLVLLGVVVVAFAIESLKLGGAPSKEPPATQKFARGLGFFATVISAGALTVALALAVQTTGGADRLPSDSGSITPTAAPSIVDTPGDKDEDVAWTFAPVLHLQHDEEYPPIAINDEFLRGTTESGAKPIVSPSGGAPGLNTLPTECRDGEHYACGTISCPKCVDWKKQAQPEGFVAQGVFYARVTRRSSRPRVLSGWNPWGDQLATLVQYWIFYGYNRWEAETVMGRLTQEHQGDWEAVSVGLDTNEKPLFVALSAHCGGQVVDWSKIAAAPGKLVGDKVVVAAERAAREDDVTHPIVAVAKGSHANYAVAAGRRPPDWGSCKRLPSDALSGLSYASNVRDLTEDGNSGWFAYPKDVKVVTDDTRPMSYPGAWGDGETVTFAHHKPIRTSSSPLSPPLQARSWRMPIRLYFCDSHWHGDRHGSKQDCR